MPKMTYKEEEKIRDSAHLKGLLEQLPPFLFIYFRGIAQTTSVKTRIGYAYDLKVFFNFLCEKNDNFIGVDFEDINVSMLETITPQDIEEFLDYVTSYVPAIISGVIISCFSGLFMAIFLHAWYKEKRTS